MISSFSFICNAGRIVNRKVKEAPKVCAKMIYDELLSKGEKVVFGTLKNSIIIDHEIKILNDLGKVACQWPFSFFDQYGNVKKFNFYIDEFKNELYPYIQNEDQKYLMLSIPLSTCKVEKTETLSALIFPKCEKPATKKTRKKARKK